MQTLIVSSSPTPTGVGEKILEGKHPRIDYLELARQMHADYVDFNRFETKGPARWLENKLRMDFRQAVWVAHLVRKKGYQNVLMMSERVAIPIAHLLPKTVKQIVIGHHLMSPYKLRLVKMTQIYRKWGVIIAPTHAETAGLQAFLQPVNPLELIPFPIDTQFFKPGNTLIPAANADHILSVGLSYRDYPTLLAALKNLPHITCHLRVGSSWVAGRGGIEHAPLPENVVLQPFVPLLELLHCYERCRFVVIPVCRTTQWSAGSISVLLAQAMGKPIIVSKTPGMPDYVLHGETGLLVEMSNPEAMAEAIDQLWRDPARVEAMGKRAQAWVAETFSLDDWVTKMSGLLQKVTDR
jgi:glycosyltransferase involved in cell wall biosynthesis